MGTLKLKLQELWANHRSWVYSAVGAVLFLTAGLAVTLLPTGREPQATPVTQPAQQAANFIAASANIDSASVPDPEQEPTGPTPEPEQWCLYITGAVRNPNVYYLPKNSRLHHLVEAAGGFNSFADREAVNLAVPLDDGWHVHIPRKGENKDSDTVVQNETPVYAPGMFVPVSVSVHNTVPIIPGADTHQTRIESTVPVVQSSMTTRTQTSNRTKTPTKAQTQTVRTSTVLININRASKEELQSLRGIGPAIATRIVDYRQQHGTFSRIEDIKKVKGIGDAKFRGIKDQITVR